MTIALVSSVSAGALNGTTSAAINTTGASLITLHLAISAGGSAPTVSDSQGNTWTARTVQQSSGNRGVRSYYCYNPTTNASHTFTVSATGGVLAFAAAAWSGTDATSAVYSMEDGNPEANGVTSTSVGTNGLTPTEDNCVVITATALNDSVTSFAGANGFTTVQFIDLVGGSNYGLGVVYKVQTTATAQTSGSSVSSWSGATSITTASQVFKPGSGGGGGSTPKRNLLLRVG